MRIETANIRCEFCDSIFDSNYDPNYDARIENVIKPYVEDLSKLFSLSYKEESNFRLIFDEDKFSQLHSNLQKKYSKRFKEYEIKTDYICKSCGRFSATLYNALRSVEFRIKEIRDLYHRLAYRDQEEIRLEYFGIIYDLKFQYELDYISKRFIYEKDNPGKKNITYFSFGHSLEAKISYERCETFSCNYEKLTFLFTGIFTTEIKNCLIEKTIDFVEHLGVHNVINFPSFENPSLNTTEIKKFNSYICILEDVFLAGIKSPNSINAILNYLLKKIF